MFDGNRNKYNRKENIRNGTISSSLLSTNLTFNAMTVYYHH